MNELFRSRGRQSSRRNADRGGIAMVAALMCMLLVMSIIGGMLHSAVRARRSLRAERDLRQTEFLLQAGVDRAAFRLRSDPDYLGEEWAVPSGEIIGLGDGQVDIGVSQNADGVRRVRVVAEYPRSDELSMRRSRTFFVQVP